MKPLAAAIALAIAGLITTGEALAQVSYVLTQPVVTYQTAPTAFVHPAAVAPVSYGYLPSTYSVTPVGFGTVSYPQLTYASPVFYTVPVASQLHGLTVMPAYHVSGVAYR